MQNIKPLLVPRRSCRKSCQTINQPILAPGSLLPLLDQRVRQGGQREPGGGEEQGPLPGAAQPRRRGNLDQEWSPQVPRGQQQGRPRHAGGVRLYSGHQYKYIRAK